LPPFLSIGGAIMGWARWAFVVAAFGLQACAIHSSTVAVAPSLPLLDRADVRLTALEVPPQARELGMVRVHADSTDIEDLIERFVHETARLGGDLAKIDSIDTRFEEEEEGRTVSCDCGTDEEPRTCSRTETVSVETATTRHGRLLR
jgi:hypothetical protein